MPNDNHNEAMELRVPPHSMEAEEGLLASCLISDSEGGGIDALMMARSIGLTSADFFKDANAALFRVICDMEASGTSADSFNEIELFERLQKQGIAEEVGGLAYIYHIQGRVDTGSHAKYFARLIKEKSTARKTIRACREAVETLYTGQIDPPVVAASLEAKMQAVSDETIEESLIPIRQVANDYAADLVRRISGEEEELKSLCSTHLTELNAVLPQNGFLPGHMIVLGARPSIGKTSLAMNFVEHTGVDENGNVLVFSLEMTAPELMSRLACARARVDSKEIDDRSISPVHQQRLAKAIQEIREAKIWIEAKDLIDIHQIRAQARMIANKCKRKGEALNLVVIDYLQLIQGTDERLKREAQIAEISRYTKIMAKEVGCPVVILSQLNRASEKDNRPPRLSDLRESGTIEQDADEVLLLHKVKRDDVPEDGNPDEIDLIKLLHAKVRNGPVGEFLVKFHRRFAKFTNYEE